MEISYNKHTKSHYNLGFLARTQIKLKIIYNLQQILLIEETKFLKLSISFLEQLQNLVL